MRLRSGRKLAQACGPLLGEAFQRLCISAPPLCECLCLCPCSWHSWELGCCGNSGVHLEEWDLSMELVFCTPGCVQCMLLFSLSQGSFFSPAGCHCFEMFSTSPFTEKSREGCATCFFSILSLWSWNLGPKKAGAGLFFQRNHTDSVSSLV